MMFGEVFKLSGTWPLPHIMIKKKKKTGRLELQRSNKSLRCFLCTVSICLSHCGMAGKIWSVVPVPSFLSSGARQEWWGVALSQESESTEVSTDLNEDTLLQPSKKTRCSSDGQIHVMHPSGTHTIFITENQLNF